MSRCYSKLYEFYKRSYSTISTLHTRKWIINTIKFLFQAKKNICNIIICLSRHSLLSNSLAGKKHFGQIFKKILMEQLPFKNACPVVSRYIKMQKMHDKHLIQIYYNLLSSSRDFEMVKSLVEPSIYEYLYIFVVSPVSNQF